MKNSLSAKTLIFSGILPVGVLLDQWTKHLVHAHFRWGESVDIVPHFFALTYVRNMGGAFSLLHDAPQALRDPFFLFVPLLALIIISVLLVRLKSDQKYVATALSLIFSGAIGNLIDRIRFGFVIDFLDFHWKEIYHWPAFNIADSCIVVGVVMMFLESFFVKKDPA